MQRCNLAEGFEGLDDVVIDPNGRVESVASMDDPVPDGIEGRKLWARLQPFDDFAHGFLMISNRH